MVVIDDKPLMTKVVVVDGFDDMENSMNDQDKDLMTKIKTWVLETYTWQRCPYKCPYTRAHDGAWHIHPWTFLVVIC